MVILSSGGVKHRPNWLFIVHKCLHKVEAASSTSAEFAVGVWYNKISHIQVSSL